MNVLSLFDGMSGGQLALTRGGFFKEHEYSYFASEIDKYAMAVTQYKFPNTVQLGDINNWKEWRLPKIDLILAGSPCQGFSHAGKGLNFDDPRSKLFFTFVEVMLYYNPEHFILENVKMKKEWSDIITSIMNVEPIEINSALVSAQNRKRLYWTNIPVNQPKDRYIYLEDVVLDDALIVGRVVGRRINEEGKRDDYNYDIKPKQRLELREDNKSGALTTVLKDNMVLTKKGYAMVMHNLYGGFGEKKHRVFLEKSPTIRTSGGGGHIPSLVLEEGLNNMLFHRNILLERTKTSIANFLRGVPYNVLKDNNVIRKFHPMECERLQTVPDNYTKFGNFNDEIRKISPTQRYKMLGNGWTIDVIFHILLGLY